MLTFQINVLIQFLASCTCFEHRVFIISSLAGERLQHVIPPEGLLPYVT
jgi:hypothetical protein